MDIIIANKCDTALNYIFLCFKFKKRSIYLRADNQIQTALVILYVSGTDVI